MTSLTCRKVSLLALGIGCVSLFFFWQLLDSIDYVDETKMITSTGGSMDSELELPEIGLGFGTESGPPEATSGQAFNIIQNSTSNITEEDKIESMNYFLWSRKPSKVNWAQIGQMCKAILTPPFNQSDQDISLARNWTIPYAHTDSSMLSLLSNCTVFSQLVPFPTKSASSEEAEFPLAYVVVAARNVAQTVRLLRMIYQPQNVYCLTYDNKTSETLKNAIKQLASCFERGNVFLTPKPENIYYTHYSILHSVTVCMEVLLNQSDRFPWKYVQIVSWNDLPLRTNSEMVRIFQILNGSQDCALDRTIEGFYVFYHDIRGNAIPQLHKPVTPDGLTMYKGSYATSMSRQFVQFLFDNPTSQKFYKWLNGSKCAEEQYWVTIVHNVHLNAPGSFPGQCMQFYAMRGRKKPFVSRYQVWTFSSERCKGKMTNFSCVYGVRDVADLIKRPELIAHKFYEEFEPAAAFCLEQWYWKRIQEGIRVFNETYYNTLPSVRYHNLKDKDNFVC